jgi:superfamily II DNA or RNA helicase
MFTVDTTSGTIAFRTGLVSRIVTRLKGHGWDVTVWPDHAHTATWSKFISHGSMPLRPYQVEAVEAMINAIKVNQCRGIIQIATGGGKTEVAVAMYLYDKINTMFLVHRKDLLYQAKERFERYGVKVGVLGDGVSDLNHNIVIATMQTLISRWDDPDVAERIASTSQVFFDEAHMMASTLDKGNQFTKVADGFKKASSRWGLTATPFMRSKYDNLLLEGVTGTVIYQISNAELIKQGYLTAPKIHMKKVQGQVTVKAPKYNPRRPAAGGAHWRDVEDLGIKFHVGRTTLIANEIQSGPFPVLVLCKTTEQATFIKSKFNQVTGKVIDVITGKDSTSVRQECIARLKAGTLDYLITTTIFDEGIDIPNLRKVILASGGKSQVKLLQRVGRGLRIAADKNELIVIDFADTHHAMLKKHALERLRVWQEEGFDVIFER